MGSLLNSERKVGRVERSIRLRLIVPAYLAVVAGCTTEQVFRSLERTYPPSQVSAQPIVGATPKANASKSARPSGGTGPVASPARLAAPTIQQAASPAAPLSTHVIHDSSVKPAANDVPHPPPSPLVFPPPEADYPIDLATALRLADVSNPTIGVARTMILEALALQLTARTLLLPSLNSGVSYHGHNGLLQRSSGKMIDVSLQSVFTRLGRKPCRRRARRRCPA